jgi:hypothetical protein
LRPAKIRCAKNSNLQQLHGPDAHSPGHGLASCSPRPHHGRVMPPDLLLPANIAFARRHHPRRGPLVPSAPGPACGRRVHRRAFVAPALPDVPARHDAAPAPFVAYLTSLLSPSLALVSNFFLGFTQRVATEAGVRRVTFHGMSTFSLAMCFSLAMRGPPPESVQDGVPFHMTGFPKDVTITVNEVPHAVVQAAVADDLVTRFLADEVHVREEAGVPVGCGIGTGTGRPTAGTVVANMSLLRYTARTTRGDDAWCTRGHVQGVLAGRVPHLRHPRWHRRRRGRWRGRALAPPRRRCGALLPKHRGRGRVQHRDGRCVRLLLSGQLRTVRRHSFQLHHNTSKLFLSGTLDPATRWTKKKLRAIWDGERIRRFACRGEVVCVLRAALWVLLDGVEPCAFCTCGG